ncbi:MAG: dihydroorotate dehydrogenase-like protein [Bacteroidetes bacterium]|nr:dihydroorotate dehydrogenase-like protein [Bacteroidota bacterium]
MINLETTYLGLKLKNPIIVGSSGLTNSVDNVIEIEKNGAGAVVLKSLFEEQILEASKKTFEDGEMANYYPEAQDYIHNYTKENDINIYLNLIKDCKKSVEIPIIASINCFSDSDWMDFARRIEKAGADALELNVFILPSDMEKNGIENEKAYLDIANKITSIVQIPVALKLSYYFSSLAKSLVTLSWTKIKGLVLFNRFFSPDIDIDHLEIKSSNVFSTPSDLSISLRWVAMLSNNVHCDIAASTGIHDGKAVIKQLLAGAKAVQIASVLYKKGFKEIGLMLEEIKAWMEKMEFDTIEEFRGKMSFENTRNPAAWERVQFMKYFSGIE